MKLALAQINTTVGDFPKNLKLILENLQQARRKKVDLVVFPELTLTGYSPQDLLERPDFIEENLKTLEQLRKQVTHPACLVGFVDRNPLAEGKPLANAAALIHQKKIVAVVHKRLLPTYDVFDEHRYFEPGKSSSVVEIFGKKIGLSICEDIWSDPSYWGRDMYPIDPILAAVEDGAEYILNMSASPYSLEKLATRYQLLSGKARHLKVPIAYVNLVGGNDDLVFDGASLAFDAKGRPLLQMASFEEGLGIVDLDHSKPQKKISHSSHSKEEKALDALILGLKDYMRKCGFQKVVLGLSGGLDSALTAWIAVQALGAKNVLGVSLPSPYSSRGSVEDALSLAKCLKMEYRNIPIADLYSCYLKALGYPEVPEKVDTTLQNIQARIRGNVLMALSNAERRLLLSTGNKSELSMGYCTLYGDMAGGFSVLSDVPKTLAYRLAKAANRRFKAIPISTIRKEPSAELAPDQKDQDDLPPYEVLDQIIYDFVERQMPYSEMMAGKYPNDLVLKVLSRLDANEYKRRQAAPGIRITSKAFGYGRRVPIAQKYRIKL